MIRLGERRVSLYSNSGFTYENHGGTIVFRGSCTWGNASSVSVGPKGNIVFGERFKATASMKLASYCGVEFGDDVLLGWDCLITDSDFHKLKGNSSKGYAPIVIGNHVWIAQKSLVLKGTNIPNDCVVAAVSMTNQVYQKEKCVLAGVPARIIKEGVYRDPKDDKISYDAMS